MRTMKTKNEACPFCGNKIKEPNLVDKVKQMWILYNDHYERIHKVQKGYLEYKKKYGTHSEVKKLEKVIEQFEKIWKDVNI